jgi:hypothetical protein
MLIIFIVTSTAVSEVAPSPLSRNLFLVFAAIRPILHVLQVLSNLIGVSTELLLDFLHTPLPEFDHAAESFRSHRGLSPLLSPPDPLLAPEDHVFRGHDDITLLDQRVELQPVVLNLVLLLQDELEEGVHILFDCIYQHVGGSLLVLCYTLDYLFEVHQGLRSYLGLSGQI